MEELGTYDEDPGTRGGQPEGIRDVFIDGSIGGAYFRFRDLGTDPPHGTGPGKFQHRVARRITGRNLKRQEEGGW